MVVVMEERASEAQIIRAVGYGAGTRDPASHANVVRAVVGSALVNVIAQAACGVGHDGELDARVEEYVRWLKS